ncbi:MAG: isopeptide-forming domain-containing fimbrial protein [Ruminococcus sp.]|jgi:fimbrial isopeptide formation D2 family protein/LPXTG-motif cell wall-anchored protein|uniref:isopeptide-forming domain-containing fimbrial protein n=1 Tax=uncultured Ruminococcus sp. TaxID=165186 RepID=UPI00262E0B2E|nr:isopeptide-forming domain-containing fimbrial protein [uncultured Ruminococcus sp.]
MKKTRRFASLATAAILAACAVVPATMSALPVSAADITITGVSTEQAHTFEVYQIFTADIAEGTNGEQVLSNVKWGSGITSYNGTAVTAGTVVDEAVLNSIAGGDARDVASKCTLSDTKACDDVTSAGETAKITGLADGYYIVKDVTDLSSKDDANSAYIVQVAGDTTVAIKNAKPTVDKQVYDEPGDAEEGANEGWGESADHAINKSFQFKLTATVPVNADLKAYKSYQLQFEDSMSTGVTFDSIASVTVKSGNAEKILTAADYTETATAETNKAGLSWTLKIDDLKTKLPENVKLGENEIQVEVVYNAHLNENAVVSKEDVTNGTKDTVNNNKVDLVYSNNPDSTGAGTTGKTPEDYVWVFTYGVDNTKYKNAVDEKNALKDAGFTLYDKTGTTETEISLIYDDAKGAYRPITGSEAGGEMKSATDGKFNIIGLDAGTYVLKETSTPAGYNTCAPINIVISAVHKENTDGTSVKLDLDGSENMTNAVINKSGSSLPSTGGIGTTIFYVAGGVLVVGAGVLLITKKRAKDAQ